MASRITLRSWLATVVVVAGVGLAGGLVAPSLGRDARTDVRPSTAVSLAPTAPDAAVVPARTEAGPTSATARHGPGRWLAPVLVALLGAAGLSAVGRGRPTPPAAIGARAVRARRCTIALRAPPLRPLV